MENLKEARTGFEAIGNSYDTAPGILREDIEIAGVPCAWFIPRGAGEDGIVFFIHGGGFIFGSIHSHAPMVSYITTALNRKVLAIDYRLAPEHPFPAGINDCVTVVRSVTAASPGVSFGIIGDSAGGNLVMATQLRLKEQHALLPHYTILISPWADLQCNRASYERNKELDSILSQAYLKEAAGMYAGMNDVNLPQLSSVNGDFKGFPPVLILCGTYEILEDDSIALYKRLRDCGVTAELILFEGELHVWPFMDISSAGSRRALNEMTRFASMYARIDTN